MGIKAHNLLVNALASEDYKLALNLLKLDSNPNLKCPTLEMTALEWAASYPNFDWIDTLMNYGGDLNNSYVAPILTRRFEHCPLPHIEKILNCFKKYSTNFPQMFSNIKDDQMEKIFEKIVRLCHEDKEDQGKIVQSDSNKIIIDCTMMYDLLKVFLKDGKEVFDHPLAQAEKAYGSYEYQPRPFLKVAQILIQHLSPIVYEAPYEIVDKKLIIHVTPEQREKIQRKHSTNDVWFTFGYTAIFMLNTIAEFGYLDKFKESFSYFDNYFDNHQTKEKEHIKGLVENFILHSLKKDNKNKKVSVL